jgi:ankyrin repeat protein
VTVHQESNDGWTPLCYACENGNVEVVKALLATYAVPNHRTSVFRVVLIIIQALQLLVVTAGLHCCVPLNPAVPSR